MLVVGGRLHGRSRCSLHSGSSDAGPRRWPRAQRGRAVAEFQWLRALRGDDDHAARNQSSRAATTACTGATTNFAGNRATERRPRLVAPHPAAAGLADVVRGAGHRIGTIRGSCTSSCGCSKARPRCSVFCAQIPFPTSPPRYDPRDRLRLPFYALRRRPVRLVEARTARALLSADHRSRTERRAGLTFGESNPICNREMTESC